MASRARRSISERWRTVSAIVVGEPDAELDVPSEDGLHNGAATVRCRFLAMRWAPFRGELQDLIGTIERRLQLGYKDEACLPLRNFELAELAKRNLRLTEVWYGLGHSNMCAVYSWFLRAMELSGVTAYSFGKEVHSYFSTDGWLCMRANEPRNELMKGMKMRDAKRMARGLLRQQLGATPIDNSVLCNAMRPLEASLLLAGYAARRFVLKLVQLRQRRALLLVLEHTDLQLAGLTPVTIADILRELRAEELAEMGIDAKSLSWRCLVEHGMETVDWAQVPEADKRVVTAVLHAHFCSGFHQASHPEGGSSAPVVCFAADQSRPELRNRAKTEMLLAKVSSSGAFSDSDDHSPQVRSWRMNTTFSPAVRSESAASTGDRLLREGDVVYGRSGLRGIVAACEPELRVRWSSASREVAPNGTGPNNTGDEVVAREEVTHDAFEAFLSFARSDPGSFFCNDRRTHLLTLIAGLWSGRIAVVKRSVLEGFTHAKYLPVCWQRRVALVGSSRQELRAAGAQESSRFRANEAPYGEEHAMSLGGGGFSSDTSSENGGASLGLMHELNIPRDPSAKLPNWDLVDIEKICTEAKLLNPSFGAALAGRPLPGDTPHFVGQNPKVASSIGGTQHTQVFCASLSTFPVYQLAAEPLKLGASLGPSTTVELVPVGIESPDACLIRITCTDPATDAILKFLSGLRQHLNESCGGPLRCDFFCAVLSNDCGGFCVFFTALAQLEKRPLGDSRGWRNPLTGRDQAEYDLPYNRVCVNSAGGIHWVTKEAICEQYLGNGEATVRKMYDFHRVPGHRALLESFAAAWPFEIAARVD